MEARTQAAVVVVYALARDEKGAAALEYGLILALLGIGLMAGAQNFGSALQQLFSSFTVAFG